MSCKSANAQIFVAGFTDGTIQKYTTSGTVVNASLVTGLSEPAALVVSGSNLFSANAATGTIGEYTTSGAAVNAALVTGLHLPFGLAISGQNLFVANANNGTIGQYTASGTAVNTALVTGLTNPTGVAVSGSHLFVVNGTFGTATISEYTTSGAVVNAALVTGLIYPYGISVSGSNLFVVDAHLGTISEYTTSGVAVNTALVTGLDVPVGVFVSGPDLFVTTDGSGSPTAGTIGEYTTSGAVVNAALVTGLNNPQALAVISNIAASSGNYDADVGQSLLPVFDGGTLTTVFNATDTNNYVITVNGGTIDGAGYTLTFTGTIADAVPGTPGHLTIANSGAGGWVVLTGANTYSGGTTIQTGANAMAGNNAAFGSGRVDMAQGSTLGFSIAGLTLSNAFTVSGDPTFATVAGGTDTIAGAIADGSSPGVVIVAGTGTLVLTGANTYSGGTTIQTGASAMAGNNAAFGTGRIDMAQGSTLGFTVSGLTLNNAFTVSGDPTFTTVTGGTDTIAGTIADGSSPGIVVVAGTGTLVLSGVNTYTGGTNIAPGATLQIGIGGTIGPGAVNNAGNLILSTPQTILGNYTQTGTLTLNAASANGGRMITAGSANMPNAQVVFNAQNGFVPAPGSNYVLVVANAAGTSYAGDRLTVNVPGSAGLYNLATLAAGATSDLVIQFQSNPTIYADTLMAARASFLGVSDAVSTQIAAFRGAPAATGANAAKGSNGMTVWLSASGQYTHTSAGNGAAGYDNTGGGAVFGLDKLLAPGIHVGGAIAIDQQSIAGGNSTSFSGQTGQLQLYAGVRDGAKFLELQAGLSTEQGTVKRGTAQGSLVGYGGGASVKAGLRYTVSDWNVEPSVAVGGLALSQNATTESNGGGSNLAIGRGNLASFYTLTGFAVDRSFAVGGTSVLTASARLGWLHEMAATSASLSASNTSSSTLFGAAPIGRDAADIGVQVELRTAANFSIFGTYRTLLDGRSYSQNLQAGIKYSW